MEDKLPEFQTYHGDLKIIPKLVVDSMSTRLGHRCRSGDHTWYNHDPYLSVTSSDKLGVPTGSNFKAFSSLNSVCVNEDIFHVLMDVLMPKVVLKKHFLQL